MLFVMLIGPDLHNKTSQMYPPNEESADECVNRWIDKITSILFFILIQFE